jgi:hypothetical protein
MLVNFVADNQNRRFITKGLDDFGPIKYTDPSGHMVSEDDKYECGAKCQQDFIFRKHQELISKVKSGKIESDLEALAQLTEYAAFISGECTQCFVENLGAVLTGHDKDLALWREFSKLLHDKGVPGPDVPYSVYYVTIRGNSELMQSGYADIFQDPYAKDGYGGNQAHYYWFYVQAGYQSYMVTGLAANLAHETILGDSKGKSYQDYALGVQGVLAGEALWFGLIKPKDFGNFIRRNLSPGSASAFVWSNPTMLP